MKLYELSGGAAHKLLSIALLPVCLMSLASSCMLTILVTHIPVNRVHHTTLRLVNLGACKVLLIFANLYTACKVCTLRMRHHVDRPGVNNFVCIAVDSMCASYTDCTSCLTSGAGYNHTSSGTDSRCGWCSATKSCLPGITTGPTQGSCATQSWSAAAPCCGQC